MYSRTAPLVVKMGGSLFAQIPALAPILKESSRPLFIVPGGGRFADLVRSLAMDDEAAHWMAIAAMEQTGWYIASHGIPPTSNLASPSHTAVWLPYLSLRQEDPLPHSWDVTSDTIAAWAAHLLGCELLLLKSVDGLKIGGELEEHVHEPFGCDEVDNFFLPFVFEHGVQAMVINGCELDRVRAYLRGVPVRGTVIHTRI